MSQGFGMEAPSAHKQPGALRQAARYLVLIESGGAALARLFGAAREPLAEFDASTEETASMTAGLRPEPGAAAGAAWDQALAGHSAAERAAAEVYRLDI